MSVSERGTYSQKNQPLLELSVLSPTSRETRVYMLVDTGFNHELLITEGWANALGVLPTLRTGEAKGIGRQPVPGYWSSCRIKWFDVIRETSVFVMYAQERRRPPENEERLAGAIGLGLLLNTNLLIRKDYFMLTAI